MSKNMLCSLVAGLIVVLFATGAWAQEPIASASTQSSMNDGRGAVVFYLDAQYHPVARLDRLGPISEGLKAILAMYALQVGAGCETDEQCVLNQGLGLGTQCSEQQINLVNSWFKTEIVILDDGTEGAFQRLLKSGDFGPICSRTPSRISPGQNMWEIIRVKNGDNLVFVDATSCSVVTVDGPCRRTRFQTEYRINSNSITIVSHNMLIVTLTGDR